MADLFMFDFQLTRLFVKSFRWFCPGTIISSPSLNSLLSILTSATRLSGNILSQKPEYSFLVVARLPCRSVHLFMGFPRKKPDEKPRLYTLFNSFKDNLISSFVKLLFIAFSVFFYNCVNISCIPVSSFNFK